MFINVFFPFKPKGTKNIIIHERVCNLIAIIIFYYFCLYIYMISTHSLVYYCYYYYCLLKSSIIKLVEGKSTYICIVLV